MHRALVSTAVLAYTLGLRHALDADHISVYAPTLVLAEEEHVADLYVRQSIL
jgi:high-affinity nickel permease